MTVNQLNCCILTVHSIPKKEMYSRDATVLIDLATVIQCFVLFQLVLNFFFNLIWSLVENSQFFSVLVC